MVSIKKELTHLYHLSVVNDYIPIGASSSVLSIQEELFKKSLALTSDLKRLPFLLGGKVYFWLDAHALYNVTLSTIVGLGITIVLMNGAYVDADFVSWDDLITDDRARDDILLVAHGTLHYHVVPLAGIEIDLTPSHWDFEGNIPLYDTITLILFLDADTNVASANYSDGKIKGEAEIEIDWRPFNKAELQEFIMEHIYAKQGD